LAARSGRGVWLDDLFSWGAALLLMVLSVFLMVPVASAITSMFLDGCGRCRLRPNITPICRPPTHVPFGDALRDTVNFMGVLIGVNIVALVLYLMFAPFAPLIFWSVNGFLLGANISRLPRSDGWAGPKQSVCAANMGLRFWAAGFLMAIPLSVPLFEPCDSDLRCCDLYPFVSTNWRRGPVQQTFYIGHGKPTRQDDPCDDRPENDRDTCGPQGLFLEVVMFGGPCMGALDDLPQIPLCLHPPPAAGFIKTIDQITVNRTMPDMTAMVTPAPARPARR